MTPLKTILSGFAFLLVASQSHAEYRTLLLQAKQNADKKVAITIFSDEKAEQRSGASVDEAVKILTAAKGWGSAVGVYVVADRGVPRGDVRKVLAAIEGNLWLELEYFGRETPKAVGDHFLKPNASTR